MLILLPIGLLLLGSVAILIIDLIRPRFGTSWLIAVVSGVTAWLVILFSRLRLPTTLDLLSWNNPAHHLTGHFSLLLDYQSWPYALAMMTILLALLLTDAARTRFDSSPRAWVVSLAITALGLFAIQSGTSLTMMMAWVVVDLVELFNLLLLQETTQFNRRIIIAYGVRTASILLLYLGTMLGWAANGDFSFAQVPSSAGFVFLLAAGLRLGVIPLNLPFLVEPVLRRGAGNTLRLAPVAASLTLLAHLPGEILMPGSSRLKTVLMALLALAALYAAARWVAAKDEIAGRPYWIVAWASFTTVSVLNGAPQSGIPWGMALILSGSLLFLYYPRIQRINFLLLLGLWGMLGLPFSPAASGWAGLLGDGFTLWTFLLLVAHGLMILGFLEHALKPGSEIGALESWARLVFPLGLILIIQVSIVLGLFAWPGVLTPGLWWMALISNAMILAALILSRRFGVSPPHFQLPISSRAKKVTDWFFPRLEPVFRFEWVYRVTWKILGFFSRVRQLMSSIFEGEGGILWTVLLLVLLISLLTGGGVN
jgi:hypothetical protein